LWLAKHHPDKAKAKGEAGLEETDFIKEYGNILLKTNNVRISILLLIPSKKYNMLR
jgi:hypothetical protein